MTTKTPQLDLFPEQPAEVDLILSRIKKYEQNLENAKMIFENSLYLFREKIRNEFFELQNFCIHPADKIKTETNFDYHKREEWTTRTCTVCEKILERV